MQPQLQFPVAMGAAGMAGGCGGRLPYFRSLSVWGKCSLSRLEPGNIEVSLAANIGLASAIAMRTMGGDDSMIPFGVALAVGSGIAIGLVNFLLIAALRIPPIIATLSASFIIQSLDISYGRGLQIKPPPGFANFSNLQVLGVPVFVVGALLMTVGFGVVLHRMVFGDGSPQSAGPARSLAGGHSGRTYPLFNLCPLRRIRRSRWGLARRLLRGASVDIGNEYQMASIAVVVIGGTSVGGGQATVTGLWGASLFLVFLQIMLNTLGTDAGTRLLITGLVIIAVITAAGAPRVARA